MTTGSIQHVPLSSLSIDPRNIRKAGRGQAEPAFIGSIERKGVIEPMIVRESMNAGFLITNGGKRFSALQHMQKKGLKAAGIAVTESFPVAIIVRNEDDGAATETSLVTNIVRAPTHPVDQYEAFAELVHLGDKVEDIARRYGMKDKEVRQALSLARIHPEIRDAWRAGTIGGDAAEAYAQTQDLEHQLRVFKKLKNRAGEEWQVNNEIEGGHDSPRIDQLLKFVGVKEYEAAGHQVNPSLFDDRDSIRVNNVPALRAMAAKKIGAECERLKDDGWAWVISATDKPNDIHSWRRLPPDNASKEQKASAGCVVAIDYSGKLSVERGYIKPGEKIRIEKTPAQKKAAQAAKTTREETGGVSGGLALRLSEQITKAAHAVLLGEPQLALRVAITAMACDGGMRGAGGDSPAKISVGGMPDLGDDQDREFAKYWKLTSGKTVPELLKMLATWTARSLDMRCHSAQSLPLSGDDDDDPARLLLNVLPAKTMNAALRQHFDAADYFRSVSAQIVMDALSEMSVLPPSAGKKAHLVEAAIIAQGKTGWLPRELRTAHYDGPAAKTMKAKPTKSATKAKAKRTRG